MIANKPKIKLVKRLEKNSSTDKLNDLYYILLTLSKGEEQGIPITNGVLIKTLFSSKIDLSNNKGIDFLNIGFHPYKMGPWNKLFFGYLDELSEVGLIQKEGYNLSLTTKGLNLIQPIFEEVKKLNKEYSEIESSIEKNLGQCEDFYKTVDKIHEEPVLDEDAKTIITIHGAVKDQIKYGNKYLEGINETTKKVFLPNTIINKLFKTEADVAETDFKETETFNNVAQLLKSVG